MSESEKPQDHNGPGDRTAEQKEAPIDPEKVGVAIVPQKRPLIPSSRAPREAQQRIKDGNKANKRLADKCAEPATREVREAIERAAPGGRQEQLDAAKQAAEGIGSKLPAESIKEVRVKVNGEQDIVAPATEGAVPPPDAKS